MTTFHQGDIIKISGFGKKLFIIISKNAFIKATGVFHVSPVAEGTPDGPLHISIIGNNGYSGVVICEQIKLIDPSSRSCVHTDTISYNQIMNISDAIQGIFEYD
ncbi:MAG: growth inhibitor PemK [Lachnospiraceae bacterium]|jgi:mRNA interferase MazF|nr:growth inhibitor PemK [Lachnospiraceae bacterium]